MPTIVPILIAAGVTLAVLGAVVAVHLWFERWRE